MNRTRRVQVAAAWGLSALGLVMGISILGAAPQSVDPPEWDGVAGNAKQMLDEGRQTFRYDTFGDQAFWGGTLRLHEAVSSMTPVQALELGLKVDADALPPKVISALKQGKVDLNDPAVTLLLLRYDAVVGVKGFFAGETLKTIGITCALCHSTVDDSITEGVGRRRDGWANRDLNVGAIIASAPNLEPLATLLNAPVGTVKKVLKSWGPGKFDAELLLDGQAFGPDGKPAATLLPPAFGLAGVNEHTWGGGWGTVTYWNALVANIEMGGKGTFIDPRLDDKDKYPVAAAAGFGHIRHPVDLVTPKLPALHFYQLAIPAPPPPTNSFDAVAAARGEKLFEGVARCADCHVKPLFTEPGWNSHTPEEIGIDVFQADRSPDQRYRTAPLKGLWTHQKGGFYHDGRFPTLGAVVDHYDKTFQLNLTQPQKADLVQYLLSL